MTGMLTRNAMVATSRATADDVYSVTGNGYAPELAPTMAPYTLVVLARVPPQTALGMGFAPAAGA